MKRLILPDSGPLGDITNPQLKPAVKQWLLFLKAQKIWLQVPAIIDYELRRNYLVEGLAKSISNLNKYRQTKRYLDLTAEDLDGASWLWAEMRRSSSPSGQGLDKDVIFAAQAIHQCQNFDQVIIVTTNSKDFRFHARQGLYIWDWKQALSDCRFGEINFRYTPNDLFEE